MSEILPIHRGWNHQCFSMTAPKQKVKYDSNQDSLSLAARARSGPRCPNCGGHLILRKIGFGHQAGKEFWDCSNVPKCFTSLEAEAVVWPQSPFSAAA
jgi:ssDNA-binding Zn-finger/Zn-ribbon topoisomerase 1